ncbi:MAG TPA: hypothetical protein VH559_02645 [Gemmatimonadaceae bacterium]
MAAVVYFGANVTRVYWHFLRFQDDMQEEARIARWRTNDKILVRLRASADSLRLPESARKISIRRTQTMISIESDYYQIVELPMMVREIHFNPRAEGPL